METFRFTAVRLGLVVLAVLALIGPWGRLPSARAADACRLGQGSLFDGYIATGRDNTGRTFEGASAVLINNPASVCVGIDRDYNFAYEWTMIHQNDAAPGGTDHGYAQVGFFAYQGSCTYYATEYNRDGNDTPHRTVRYDYGCLGNNVAHAYWVQYTGGVLRMNVDVTIMDTTPWNPFTYWRETTYGSFTAQFSAESKYISTDIAASHFGSMQVQNYNDSWTNSIGPLANSCPWPQRYINNGVANNAFGLQTSGTSYNKNC